MAGLHVPGGLADPAIERMLAHKSVRNFTGEPVNAAALEAIVAAAQSASSSSGLQT
jgi:nitroreductase